MVNIVSSLAIVSLTAFKVIVLFVRIIIFRSTRVYLFILNSFRHNSFCSCQLEHKAF